MPRSIASVVQEYLSASPADRRGAALWALADTFPEMERAMQEYGALIPTYRYRGVSADPVRLFINNDLSVIKIRDRFLFRVNGRSLVPATVLGQITGLPSSSWRGRRYVGITLNRIHLYPGSWYLTSPCDLGFLLVGRRNLTATEAALQDAEFMRLAMLSQLTYDERRDRSRGRMSIDERIDYLCINYLLAPGDTAAPITVSTKPPRKMRRIEVLPLP